MKCYFPTCQSTMPKSNGYCLHHQMYADSPSVSEKPGKKEIKIGEPFAIRKMKKKLMLLYSKYLAKNRACKLKRPGCTEQATEVNHAEAGDEKALLNQALWQAICNPCMIHLRDNPEWKPDLKKNKK